MTNERKQMRKCAFIRIKTCRVFMKYETVENKYTEGKNNE